MNARRRKIGLVFEEKQICIFSGELKKSLGDWAKFISQNKLLKS